VKLLCFARARQETNVVYRFGDYSLDTERLELRCGNRLCELEPQVFSLLEYLVLQRDRVVSKDELIEAVWHRHAVSDSTLNARISSARRAVGDSGKDQAIIRTFPRRGFRFIAPVSSEESVASEEGSARPLFAYMGRSAKPVVAVLPFDNLSSGEDDQYFSDGITEDIITALTKNRWLFVIARNTTFAFRDHSTNIRRVADELGADYVVEGSVRKSGNRVRITAQLVDATTGGHIWAQNYDRELADIFAVQDEITQTVVGRIEPEVGAVERHRVKGKPSQNLDAWDCYHLGLAQFYRFSQEGNAESQRLFQHSIELDPEFAGPYSWLAYAIILSMVYFDADPEPEKLDDALRHARKAVEIDDQDFMTHLIVGRVHLARCEYDLALNEVQIAKELNPCHAHAYCAVGDSLAYEGRLEESIVQFETAIRLSPHDPFRWAFYSYRALAHLFLGQFEAAVEWAQRAVGTPNCQYWSNAHLVCALGHLGRSDETSAAKETLLRRVPNFSCDFARKKLFYIKRPEQMNLYLEGLRKAGIAA
jgi:TolB-like protein